MITSGLHPCVLKALVQRKFKQQVDIANDATAMVDYAVFNEKAKLTTTLFQDLSIRLIRNLSRFFVFHNDPTIL